MNRYDLAINSTKNIFQLKNNIKKELLFLKYFNKKQLQDVYLKNFLIKINKIIFLEDNNKCLIQYDFLIYFLLKILKEIENENLTFETEYKYHPIYHLIYNDMKRNIIAKLNKINGTSFKNKNFKFIKELEKYKNISDNNYFLLQYYFTNMNKIQNLYFKKEELNFFYQAYFIKVYRPRFFKSVR